MLGNSCEYDVQCDELSGKPEARSPGAALCLGGVCQCAYSARAAGSPERCWQKKRPGQECQVDEVKIHKIILEKIRLSITY